jgi:serine/threonine protein kinase
MSEATHATPFEAPEVEEVARLFPSYEILGLIACGGMGAVYHAIQTSLDRAVAIKILPRVFSTDSEFRAGFESEAKAMAKLNHPNLIGVYDFGEVEGLLYIVMEYVAGESLYHLAHGHAVEHAEALAIVIGVCHGLAHAHEYGILHRDIKPSNILLDLQTNPKIGDFGLASAMERQFVEGEQIFGTPGYTAPEVLTPPFSIDQRADIFSVGVMLHEILTGHLPDVDPRPASQICGCNHRLDAVIQRATHPDPARRYDSAMELAQELAAIAAIPNRTLRTSSTPPAPPAPTLTSAHRRTTATASVSSAALSRPSRSLPPRPQNPFKPPRTMVKESSGSGFVIFLLLAIVIAAAVYLVMKGGNRTAVVPVPPPQPPVGGGVIEPAQPAPAAVAKDSPEDVLRRARAAIRQRVGPAIESQRRDLRTNLLDYKSAMESASKDLPFGDRERVSSTLSENLRAWENNGHRLPQTLPTGFRVVEGAESLHGEFVDKQAAIQRRFDTDMSSLSGIYILELQNQIGRLEKDGNGRAADTVEQEIRAVNSDPGRFRSLMLE